MTGCGTSIKSGNCGNDGLCVGCWNRNREGRMSLRLWLAIWAVLFAVYMVGMLMGMQI